VRIEWITPCREIDDSDFPTVNLLSANLGGMSLEGVAFPVDLSVEIAVCLLVGDDVGGMMVLRAEVYGPDGSPAGTRREQLATSEGDPLPPGFERRQLTGLPVNFRADRPGVYQFLVGIEDADDPPLGFTYWVVEMPSPA
jgi:hypothetical protein